MKSSSTLKCQVIVQERKEAGLPVYNFGLGGNQITICDKYINQPG